MWAEEAMSRGEGEVHVADLVLSITEDQQVAELQYPCVLSKP